MRERASYLNPCRAAVRNYTVVVKHPFELQENQPIEVPVEAGGRVPIGSNGIHCLQDRFGLRNCKAVRTLLGLSR